MIIVSDRPTACEKQQFRRLGIHMAIRSVAFTGDAIAPQLPVLAGLCSTVFREWPHLYDGDGRYDVAHLRTLTDSPNAMVLVAYDGDVPIGASTCLPLADAAENVRSPCLAHGWPLQRFFYFAESVVLRAYRRRGIGGQFLALREAHAHAVPGCAFCCFCTVQRPPDHPDRPGDAVPLDTFWRAQGYHPVPNLTCMMKWQEIGHAIDQDVSLTFWIKSLTG
jgi:hypothetical protein